MVKVAWIPNRSMMKKESTNHHPTTKTVTLIPMVPSRNDNLKHSMTTSSDRCTTSGASSAVIHATNNKLVPYESLIPRVDDINVYNFPVSLKPTYQNIPLRNQSLIIIMSFIISVFSMIIKNGSWNSFSLLGYKVFFLWKNWRRLLPPTIVFSLLLTLFFQETFYSPSRIDADTIARRNWLPSSLSRFENINIRLPSDTEPTKTCHQVKNQIQSVQLHYLSYPLINDTAHVQQETSQTKQRSFDILHLNHGFGASSLSWLPSLPKLAEKLQSRIAIAHDAPGFGFTQLPSVTRYIPSNSSSLIPYSAVGNAILGMSLIKHFSTEAPKSIALFGHSMGCVATLLMAKMLSQESTTTNVTVVLVAPAFVDPIPILEKLDSKGFSSFTWTKKINKLIGRIGAYLSYYLLEPSFQYILRRTVGTKNFWRNGLSQAWGDSKRLSETDVLRFQWPSVRKNWEKGLLCFTKSRLLGICTYPGGDFGLLQDVVDMPNCRVVIAYGSKDAVVPFKQIQKIQQRFPDITYISFEGLGHDPFEENPDLFVRNISRILS